jgi:hypothetical protein
VIMDSETLNKVEPLSVILNKFVTFPLLPILILNKSPALVVALPGAQLKYPSIASVMAVVLVEVELTLNALPEVSAFALISIAVLVVIAFPTKAKAPVVLAPEVNVWAPVVVVTPNVEPVEMPMAPAVLLPMDTAPVEVPVLMFVAKFEEALRLIAAPETVAPAWPVNRPAEVTVPPLVVVKLPSVVMFPPEKLQVSSVV